jgi:outer membrane lipoprotein-sorting protein
VRLNKVISIGVSMSGERYFKAPDNGALKLHSVPSIAKAFSNLYSSLGTPATWPQTYNVQSLSEIAVNGRPAYELRATYKHPSRVDHVVLDVDGKTFDPVQARWYYTNGATIVMNITEAVVDSAYRLPRTEIVNVHFPEYNGDATVEYGTYQINVEVPDSTFSP